MKHRSKFREEENHESDQEQRTKVDEAVKDFASVEELLRHDAARTDVPENLRQRVRDSLNQPSRQPWWSRFFRSQN